MTPIESCEQCSNISDHSDCGNSNNGNKKLVFFQESESCGTCREAGSIKGSDGENDRKVKHQEKLEKLKIENVARNEVNSKRKDLE